MEQWANQGKGAEQWIRKDSGEIFREEGNAVIILEVQNLKIKESGERLD